MTKLLIPVVLLAFFGGCLGTGCMPTEQSEQQRWKQATEIDAANRAVIQADMRAAREANEKRLDALSQQVTKEHTVQTPEKMDALAGVQAQFAAQAKAITDATAMAIAAANKAADDRVAAVVATNAAMPKNPMMGEAMTAIGTIVASIAGAFGIAKLSPSKGSSDESARAIAALNAKVGLPITT